jgi:hypothetical protein
MLDMPLNLDLDCGSSVAVSVFYYERGCGKRYAPLQNGQVTFP